MEVTLTIEPGVIINKTTSGDMFLLMGTLYAHGTSLEPIVFDGGGNYHIISTYPRYGNGDFEFCVFKNSCSLWDRWGKINLRYSKVINVNNGSNKAIQGACIGFDGPTDECNIEYNIFIDSGGVRSYDSDYPFNVRYNLFQRMISPICNSGSPTEMTVKFNSFIDPEEIVLWVEHADMDATENYWGTTDTSIIEQKIYDGNDDITVNNYIREPLKKPVALYN